MLSPHPGVAPMIFQRDPGAVLAGSRRVPVFASEKYARGASGDAPCFRPLRR